MTAVLRVVVDQLTAPTDPALAEASGELARALIATAPTGCEVEAVVPAGAVVDVEAQLPGVARVHRAGLARRELAAAVSLGVASGMGAGLVHSPTLFAPLVRHDRVHDHDQTVVTLWDLRAWDHPDELPRTLVSWQRAMLKRAAKHADAVVVPTHALAVRVGELMPRLQDRVRVISGAPPADFAVPSDDVGRRRELDLPDGFVLMSGGSAPSRALAAGFAAVASSGLDLPVVVIDAPEGDEPAVADIASAAGVPERMVHVRGVLDAADRAAVLGGAVALLAPSRAAAFPWRVVEALTLGVPVVAADSPVHHEVAADGALLVGEDVDALAEGLRSALGSTDAAERLAVLAADRGRAFSWRDAADRVWQLHAEL